MTDLDTLGYPEHLYWLRGYIWALDDSVVQAAWINRAQEILYESFAQHSALVEHARTLERERDEALAARDYERTIAGANAYSGLKWKAHADRYEKALRRIREWCREGHGDDLIADSCDAALAGEDA